MGLCAFDDPRLPALRRGVEYLIREQNADGSWSEDETTGTGFPRVFYLKYDIYRNTWPLLALAAYRKLVEREAIQGNGSVHHPLPASNGRVNGRPHSAPDSTVPA
jgi:squalene-hopene/tetraprenyl-beta-curcumene cyclase